METNDRQGLTVAIREFKLPSGQPNFPALFSISTQQRIPALAKEDMKRTAAIITVAITRCMQSMNLTRPMNSSQIIDLAETVIESAEEDNLALEDLLLFLQQLTRGEYGSSYEGMDMPKFMEKFGQYRDERYRAIKNHRDEEEASHRPDYSESRVSEELSMQERMRKITELVEQSKITPLQIKNSKPKKHA